MFEFITVFYIYILNVIKTFRFGTVSVVQRGPAFQNGIIILGDDYASGFTGITTFKSLFQTMPYYLSNALKKEAVKQTWNIFDCGVEGSSSTSWLPTSYKEVTAKSLFERTFEVENRTRSQIVLVMLGYNDGRLGVSPETTISNIKAITTVLLNMGKIVYISPVPNFNDHLVNDELHGANMTINDSLVDYVKQSKNQNLMMGVMAEIQNFEYKGKFLLSDDEQHFNQRGYEKMAKEFASLIANGMIKMEFAKFKQRLNIS